MPRMSTTCSILLKTWAREICSDFSWYCTLVWCLSWGVGVGEGKHQQTGSRAPVPTHRIGATAVRSASGYPKTLLDAFMGHVKGPPGRREGGREEEPPESSRSLGWEGALGCPLQNCVPGGGWGDLSPPEQASP